MRLGAPGAAILAVFAASASCLAAQGPPASALPARTVRVRGPEVLDPDGRPLRLRGFNCLWWANPDEQAARDIVALGANCVRYMFGYEPSGRFDPRRVEFVERHVRIFTSRGLWVIPTVHKFERRRGGALEQPWSSAELRGEFLEMWTCVVERLRGEPRIAAWEPLNEPHDVDELTLMKWYFEVIDRFRRLDHKRPLVLEGKGYSNPWEVGDYLKVPDPNIIYSFHMYSPHEFTHQPKEKPEEYPGRWGREFLASQLEPVVRFRERHRVPVFCGEWGVLTRAKGYERWLADVAGLLEERGFHWTHWAWVVKQPDPVDDSFDVNTHKKGIYGVMAQVFRTALARRGSD